MATIADTVRTQFVADRRTALEWWQYVMDVGTTGDEWSIFNLVLPDDVMDALVVDIVVETRNAPATARDLASENQRCSVSVNRGRQLATAVLAPRVAISEPISEWNVGVGAAGTDGWTAKFAPFKPFWIGMDDHLTVICPPVDASGTPTADAVVWLAVEAVKYSKR